MSTKSNKTPDTPRPLSPRISASDLRNRIRQAGSSSAAAARQASSIPPAPRVETRPLDPNARSRSSVPPELDPSGVRPLPGERAAIPSMSPPKAISTLPASNTGRTVMGMPVAAISQPAPWPSMPGNPAAPDLSPAGQPAVGPTKSAPPPRRAPHPASVRPPARTSGGRYSQSDTSTDVVDAARPSRPAPASVPARVPRARAVTPVRRHGRRSSRPSAPRVADPVTAPRQDLTPTEFRPSTPPDVPRTVVAQTTRYERHEPALPSVMLDPKLERERERLSRPPSRAPSQHWADAETSLIPRSMLELTPPAEQLRPPQVRAPRPWLWLTLFGAVASVALGGLWWAKRAHSAQAPAAHAVAATSPSPPVAQGRTTIISEPAGAEVFYRGALVGMTPVAVPRPGERDRYLLRLTGYQPQLVWLSPESESEMRVPLRAEAALAPTTP